MFAIMALYAVRTLPADSKFKILGINNRLFIAALSSVLCVIVELWLNHINVLRWEWAAWNIKTPYLIWLIGYMPFFLVGFWVHDMQSRKRQLTVVAALATTAITGLGLFGATLHWI